MTEEEENLLPFINMVKEYEGNTLQIENNKNKVNVNDKAIIAYSERKTLKVIYLTDIEEKIHKLQQTETKNEINREISELKEEIPKLKEEIFKLETDISHLESENLKLKEENCELFNKNFSNDKIYMYSKDRVANRER